MATKQQWKDWLKVYKKYLKDCEVWLFKKKKEVNGLTEEATLDNSGPGSNPPPPPPPHP